MSYPEQGAGYHRHPKWLQDAVEAEKRADGGEVTPAAPEAPADDDLMDYRGFKEKLRMDDGSARKDWRGSFSDREIANMRPVPMPVVENPDTGDRMAADTSENIPKFLRGKTPK